MKLHLIRHTFTDESTIGSLSIDGVFQCYTLERVADGKNTMRLSAINEGEYAVNLAYSEHFARVVPHLLNVPGRSDIEMHVANKAADLHGCVGVGRTKSHNFIGESQIAFDALMAKLEAATDPITVTIEKTQGLDIPVDDHELEVTE